MYLSITREISYYYYVVVLVLPLNKFKKSMVSPLIKYVCENDFTGISNFRRATGGFLWDMTWIDARLIGRDLEIKVLLP